MTGPSTMDLPLRGISILDLTANMSGPLGTMLLADQGAEVIKVEPLYGDVLRHIGAGQDGMSVLFANLNRNKKVVAVDLQRDPGVAVVRRLAAGCDVLVQNFRPGVIERLGLGWEDVRADNPRLIYASIFGYDKTGPLAEIPAYDHVVQAMSGIAALEKERDGDPPRLVRQGIVDKVTALLAAQGITAALLRRSVTGLGGLVDLSMLSSALYFLWPDGMANHTCLDMTADAKPISNTFKLTKTADGYISMITVTEAQWDNLMTALEIDDTSGPQGSVSKAERQRRKGQLMRQAVARLGGMATSEVVELLRKHDVPCMPVEDLEDVRSAEQVVQSGALLGLDHPEFGRIVQPRSPAVFDSTPAPLPSPAPRLGANTAEVLRGVGYSIGEIRQLEADGIIRTSDSH